MASVQVIPRFRPLNKRELSEVGGAEVVVEFEADNKAFTIVDPQSKEKKPLRFTFDHVLRPDVSQEEAYNWTAKPLLEDVFAGYNTTIFTYGQTGSGKTHTMMGDLNSQEHKGIIPRLVDGVFACIDNSADTVEFTVKVSYVEIYNEKIRDLLDTAKDNIRIRESPNGVWLEDVSQTYVRDAEEVFNVMREGGKNRSISATKMNSESSRSHSVFILTLGQKDSATGTVKGAKLTLIDLAGSEKVGKTGAEGQTLKEAQNINKSLSALGNVINALTSQPSAKDKGKKAHIPYRDSKLTYLLSDSLGGNSKTCLIITGSPSHFNLEETISTIKFGVRAKSIKNKPKVNQERTVGEYQRLLAAADTKTAALEAANAKLQREVAALRGGLCLVSPDYLNVAAGLNVAQRSGVGKTSKEVGGDAGWLEFIRDDDTSGISIEDILKEQEQAEMEGHDGLDQDGQDQDGNADNVEDAECKAVDGDFSPETSDVPEIGVSVPSAVVEQLTMAKAVADERILALESRVTLLQESVDSVETERKQWGVKETELKDSMQQTLALETHKHKAQLQEMVVAFENSQREKQHVEQQMQQLKRDLKHSDKEVAEIKAKLSESVAKVSAQEGAVEDILKKQGEDDEAKQQQQETLLSLETSLASAEKGNAKLRTNLQRIVNTLELKCIELVDSQLAISACKEHIVSLEQTLLRTQSRLNALEASSQADIANLKDKLQLTEEICRKLFDGGKYWKSQGKYSGGHGGRIVVPVQGKQHVTLKTPMKTTKSGMDTFF